MSDRDGQWDLYQVSVNSRQVTRLTQDTALDTSPIWSPDGARIAFVSNRGGSWAIRTIDSDGNNDQILLPLPGSFNGKVKDVPDTYQTGWQLEHISWVK
jgi:TolB protein